MSTTPSNKNELEKNRHYSLTLFFNKVINAKGDLLSGYLFVKISTNAHWMTLTFVVESFIVRTQLEVSYAAVEMDMNQSVKNAQTSMSVPTQRLALTMQCVRTMKEATNVHASRDSKVSVITVPFWFYTQTY